MVWARVYLCGQGVGYTVSLHPCSMVYFLLLVPSWLYNHLLSTVKLPELKMQVCFSLDLSLIDFDLLYTYLSAASVS